MLELGQHRLLSINRGAFPHEEPFGQILFIECFKDIFAYGNEANQPAQAPDGEYVANSKAGMWVNEHTVNEPEDDHDLVQDPLQLLVCGFLVACPELGVHVFSCKNEGVSLGSEGLVCITFAPVGKQGISVCLIQLAAMTWLNTCHAPNAQIMGQMAPQPPYYVLVPLNPAVTFALGKVSQALHGDLLSWNKRSSTGSLLPRAALEYCVGSGLSLENRLRSNNDPTATTLPFQPQCSSNPLCHSGHMSLQVTSITFCCR